MQKQKSTKKEASLLDGLREMQASLDELYRDYPEIAGTYFGACMSERNKEALRGYQYENRHK